MKSLQLGLVFLLDFPSFEALSTTCCSLRGISNLWPIFVLKDLLHIHWIVLRCSYDSVDKGLNVKVPTGLWELTCLEEMLSGIIRDHYWQLIHRFKEGSLVDLT